MWTQMASGGQPGHHNHGQYCCSTSASTRFCFPAQTASTTSRSSLHSLCDAGLPTQHNTTVLLEMARPPACSVGLSKSFISSAPSTTSHSAIDHLTVDDHGNDKVPTLNLTAKQVIVCLVPGRQLTQPLHFGLSPAVHHIPEVVRPKDLLFTLDSEQRMDELCILGIHAL